MEAVNALVGQISVVSFMALLIWAAYQDTFHYVIPNRVSVAIVALFPAYALTAPVPVDMLGAAGVGAAMFGVGFVLYTFRITGGGDAKLLAAVSVWAGAEQLFLFLIVTAMAGGVVSAGYVARTLLQMRSPAHASGGTVSFAALLKVQVPYALAISAGGLFVAGRMLRW